MSRAMKKNCYISRSTQQLYCMDFMQCFTPATYNIDFSSENHAFSRHAFNVARDSIVAKETTISTTFEFNLLQISQLDIQQPTEKD